MIGELEAAEALLDVGISIPLRPLRFGKWKFVPRATIKRPPLGGLLRILRLWLKTGVTVAAMNDFDERQRLEFMSTHGKEVSKMVALMIYSGFFSGKVLAPPFAAYLRWRCHPDVLMLSCAKFMQLIDSKSFIDIIRSAEAINIVAPRLSREKKRS
jgi:hypothetical protein